MFWYFRGLVNYVNFFGREQRISYFTFFIFHLLIAYVMFWVDIIVLGNDSPKVLVYYVIFTAVPFLAIRVRRVHDAGYSSIWAFFPVISTVILFLDSEKKDNRYGVSPKYRVRENDTDDKKQDKSQKDFQTETINKFPGAISSQKIFREQDVQKETTQSKEENKSTETRIVKPSIKAVPVDSGDSFHEPILDHSQEGIAYRTFSVVSRDDSLPLQVKKISIEIDFKNRKVLSQVLFKSAVDDLITDFSCRIFCYDNDGALLNRNIQGGKIDFSGVEVQKNEWFIFQKNIDLSRYLDTRKVDIVVTEATFQNGSKWKYEGVPATVNELKELHNSFSQSVFHQKRELYMISLSKR